MDPADWDRRMQAINSTSRGGNRNPAETEFLGEVLADDDGKRPQAGLRTAPGSATAAHVTRRIANSYPQPQQAPMNQPKQPQAQPQLQPFAYAKEPEEVEIKLPPDRGVPDPSRIHHTPKPRPQPRTKQFLSAASKHQDIRAEPIPEEEAAE